MNEMKEAVGNWREAKQFSPADENDFLRWLDKADTEEKLFSRLTFWFTFRGLPADQNQRYHLVQERAREPAALERAGAQAPALAGPRGRRVRADRERRRSAARHRRGLRRLHQQPDRPEAAPQQAAPEPETAKPAGVQAWSARELSEMCCRPSAMWWRPAAHGMGVAGCKPSWARAGWCWTSALPWHRESPFLGFPTRQHGTLYLALEDGKSRMQTRLRRLLEGRPAPANMHVMFQAQRLGEGLLETLGEYLDANPDIHLVCIDTLSKIKPKAKPFENAYDADYDYMAG